MYFHQSKMITYFHQSKMITYFHQSKMITYFHQSKMITYMYIFCHTFMITFLKFVVTMYRTKSLYNFYSCHFLVYFLEILILSYLSYHNCFYFVILMIVSVPCTL